jgi:hypothetical protein
MLRNEDADMRDLRSEEFFYHEVAVLLGAKHQKQAHKVNGSPGYKVHCPKCQRYSGGFGISRDGNTYILMCGDRLCGFRANLNTLINQYGCNDMKSRWWELSFGHQPERLTWGGIKNRRKPGLDKH